MKPELCIAISSYRAVNTFRLGYENKPVSALHGNNRCLLLYKYKTHNKYTLSAQCRIFNVKLGGT
jgi:hypothetical protein